MTDKESKKIVYQILNEEAKANNLTLSTSVLSNVENFWYQIITNLKKYFKNKDAKLFDSIQSTKKDLNTLKKTQGYAIGKNSEIVIFQDNIKKFYRNDTKYLYQLIKTTYHELKHVLIAKQDLDDSNNPNYFHLLMERLLRWLIEKCNATNYYERDFQYIYEEILAEQYASVKTREFLQKNYSEAYKHDQFLKEYLIEHELLEKIYQTNYDVQKILSRINKIIKKASNKEALFYFEFPNYILSSIYNKDGSYKSIKEIFKDKYLMNQPLKVKLELITSEAYLEELDYTTITIEELRVLLNAIDYIYIKETERAKANSQIREQIESFYQTKYKKDSNEKPNKKPLLVTLEEQEHINSIKILFLESQRNKVQELINNYPQNKKNKH